MQSNVENNPTLAENVDYKQIVLAVSGGIAAYKSIELLRLLQKHGAQVRVVLSESALQFVTPLTFQALSGYKVHTTLMDCESELAMGHIELARWADLLIVAPATANILAKFSRGLADDLLSTLYLAVNCPVLLAPAMNQAMWQKKVTQENILSLQHHGNEIIGPDRGYQACGDTGLGRMIEPTEIAKRVFSNKNSSLLKGISVLISAGPTREPIDPVRYISNRSSGKMGYALARAVIALGGNVTVISGPVNIAPPTGAKMHYIETAEQMHKAIMSEISLHAIYIGAAAVADYTPQKITDKKIKKGDDHSHLLLQKTKDILAEVAALPNKPFTVGFAAETDNLEAYAIDKLNRKKTDMIAANLVAGISGGFDKDDNALSVYWQGGCRNFPLMPKQQLANKLITLIIEHFNEKHTTENPGLTTR